MIKRAKSTLLNCFILTLAISLSAGTAFSAPFIKSVTLNAAVDASYYLVVFNTDFSGNGVWINPGGTTGNSVTDPSFPAGAGGAGFTATTAPMFGLPNGYGQILLSIPSTISPLSAEMGSLSSNLPVNANPTILNGATGPVNKTNIELERAIAVGTQVTFEVDMNGELPHLVMVMGGSYPAVTYDTSTGIMTVQTTTFGSTTNAGDIFKSVVGFMIVTDTSLGSSPLRIIAQTNHWAGDIFPLLPGFDSSAAVSGSGGTAGTNSAKCGTTIYGPTGENRTVSIFFPDASLSGMFGSSVPNGDSLTAYVDDGEDSSASVTAVTNFGVSGMKVTFNYTFASPRDVSLGAPSLSSSVITEDNSVLPQTFSVHQNYPNPFNPSTKIGFELPLASEWTVSIFNILGQEVDRYSGYSSAGTVTLDWDASRFSSGVYLYKVSAGAYHATKTMALIK